MQPTPIPEIAKTKYPHATIKVAMPASDVDFITGRVGMTEVLADREPDGLPCIRMFFIVTDEEINQLWKSHYIELFILGNGLAPVALDVL